MLAKVLSIQSRAHSSPRRQNSCTVRCWVESTVLCGPDRSSVRIQWSELVRRLFVNAGSLFGRTRKTDIQTHKTLMNLNPFSLLFRKEPAVLFSHLYGETPYWSKYLTFNHALTHHPATLTLEPGAAGLSPLSNAPGSNVNVAFSGASTSAGCS